MIEKEYTKDSNTTYIKNINLIIETDKPVMSSKMHLSAKKSDTNVTPFKLDKKVVYDVNLGTENMSICKGIRNSACSVNFDIHSPSCNLNCNYNDIKSISIKQKIAKFYYIPFFIGIIFSFNALISLLLSFISLILGFYKCFEITLQSEKTFKIFFKNNNIKDINILKYFICKKAPVTPFKKKRISGIYKNLFVIIPIITLCMILLNIIYHILFLHQNPIDYNIILGSLMPK